MIDPLEELCRLALLIMLTMSMSFIEPLPLEVSLGLFFEPFGLPLGLLSKDTYSFEDIFNDYNKCIKCNLSLSEKKVPNGEM